MRREDEPQLRQQKPSNGKYCVKVTNILEILYCVVIIILIIHLFVLQIFDLRKYRERGRMQRATILRFVEIFMTDMVLNLQLIEFIIISMHVLLIIQKRKPHEK